MIHVAWDLETCPLPLDALSEAQQRRYEKELRRHVDRNPGADMDEAGRPARAQPAPDARHDT